MEVSSYLITDLPPLVAAHGGADGGATMWPSGCDQGHRADIIVRTGQLRRGMGSQP